MDFTEIIKIIFALLVIAGFIFFFYEVFTGQLGGLFKGLGGGIFWSLR